MHPGESLENIRFSLLRIVNNVTDAGLKSIGIFLYYVSILLFDLLVLPFLMALLIYIFFNLFMGRLQKIDTKANSGVK